jgi:hypothetical protein
MVAHLLLQLLNHRLELLVRRLDLMDFRILSQLLRIQQVHYQVLQVLNDLADVEIFQCSLVFVGDVFPLKLGVGFEGLGEERAQPFCNAFNCVVDRLSLTC